MKDTIQHWAVDIAADCNYDLVIENLLNGTLLKDITTLPAGEGALYSHITINKIIEEELLHDHFEITTAANSSLKSMSSGEQKKALLHYLVQKDPPFIVVDNVLDNLDSAAQQHIVATLQQAATHTLIVQVIARQKDILPFINDVLLVNHNKITAQQKLDVYLKEKNSAVKKYFPGNIPPALHGYDLPAGPLLQLNDVSVSYDGRAILDKINWTVQPGEFWQLAGPNGSGKSTILSLITGDNPKGYGQDLVLFGIKKGSGETVWDIKQNIGYVNSTLAQFFPRLDSVEKMVLSGFFDSIGLYVVPNETQVKTAQAWLRTIGLFEEKDQPFCFLPLGRQRMVLTARAMVKHPPLLILDEPTASLDDNNILLFTALINKIAAETTTAILYVSHRPEAGLDPQYIFNLTPGANGSTGKMKNRN
ncbi:ATP-binding cassette domain-containing protein [Ferruginibacter sp.]